MASENAGFKLARQGKFPTKLLGGRDGYFAMAFLEVE